MKLHINGKRRKTIRRALSLAIVLCIVVSESSAFAAVGGEDFSAEGHEHGTGCYEKQFAGEQEQYDHGEDCFRDWLLCTAGENDYEHICGDGCYQTVQMTGCEAEEHSAECYKRIPVCGQDGEDEEGIVISYWEAVEKGCGRNSVSAGDGADQTEPSLPEKPGEDTDSDESKEPEEDADSGESKEPAEDTDSEDSREPGEDADSDESKEPGEDTDSEEADDPEESGKPGDGADSEETLPEDIEDETKWTLSCDSEEEGHEHGPGCYRSISCGAAGHEHREECFQEGNVVCGKEEHVHSEICFLTAGEKEAVDQVSRMIANLPSYDEITEKAAELEEDQEAYALWFAELAEQAAKAEEAYAALGEELQRYVEGAEYLLALSGVLSGVTLEENVWRPMEPDEAYVNAIEIKGILTGSAPFDEQEGRGNDTRADDMLVRTFDTINYNFEIEMKSWNSSESYSEARVKLEFVLPLSENEAVFEQTSMAWMDQTAGYEPRLTTEERLIDGVTKECQVLTCYKLLLPSAENISVVPGSFGENLTIYVRSMKNGDTVTPIISAAMEGGAWDAPCENENHVIDGKPVAEKKTVAAEPVEVTAAPKYNVRVKGRESYYDEFDFDRDEAWMEQYGDIAANTNIQAPLPGRAMILGITLQLYNDNPSKGLKGIELPNGDPITFDLELSSKFTINIPKEGTDYQANQVITDAEFAPLLWSYDEVHWGEYGTQNKDGRIIYDQHRATPFAPYTSGYNEYKTACYNGGSWMATQEGNTVHITVSGYEIDPKKMPTLNGDGGQEVTYLAHEGCFSSGELWVIQPFNKKEGTGSRPHYDIVDTYGTGSFATTVKASNLQVTSLSGDKLVQGENGFQQIVLTDDEETRTLELTLDGSMQNRVRYADAQIWEIGSGIIDNRDGRDFASVGADLYVMGGLSYNPNRFEENQMYLGTTLLKFYGNALEMKDGQDNWFLDLEGGAELNGHDEDEPKEAEKNVRIYYATKKDGEDWKSDDELKTTYEDNLDFYTSLDQIPTDKVCVGMLICLIGPGNADEDGYYRTYHKAKVRDDMSLAGQTFMLASTSRLWTKSMFERARMTLDDIDLQKNPDLNIPELILQDRLWKSDHYTSANIEGSVFYNKETYKPDGSGIVGTHNSDWYHWGDTLLVIGYKTAITKNLLQQNGNGDEKKVYNLDASQRVVDFVLQPRTYYDRIYVEGENPGENKASITVVDTLPKYMTYKPGSAYFGGKYEQTSVLGGTKGNIVYNDAADAVDKFREPVLTEPVIVLNQDGTKTLTWVIQDVKIGEPMAPIYYSVDIGTTGNPENDVPTGTTDLANKVYITTPADKRDPNTTEEKHAEAGISVTRGSASSFGKYTKQKVADEDGEIDYVVYFNNNAELGTYVTIMDTMPVNGEAGSHFTGDYTFAEWKLDTSKCDANRLNIYYTFEKEYENKTAKDLKAGELQGTNWKEAPIGDDGIIAIPGEADGATKDQPFPVAWVVVGNLDAHRSVNIDLKIKLNPGSSEQNKTENNYFVNRLSSRDTTTVTETPTVRRTLEGLTWMDYNRNGVQDGAGGPQEEIRISGIQVELLKLKEGGDPGNENDYESVFYPKTTAPVIIRTGQQISVRAKSVGEAADYEQGRYKFTDLPAGTFAVRFTRGNSEPDFAQLNATRANEGADDTCDSDGIPTYNDEEELQKTVILNLVMPQASEMYVSLYESKHHDSGFYPDTLVKIQKVAEDGGTPLEGAIFTIKDSKGQIMSFTYEENKGYTPVTEEETDPALVGKYYIAYAANPEYVMEIGEGHADGGISGGVPTLQKRNGNPKQLFEVIEHEDGYKSFRSVHYGSWLDLDAGALQNGAKIHVWSGVTPNDNEKWLLTDDGHLKPYAESYSWNSNSGKWAVDLSGNEVTGVIQLWTENNSDAQKWVLVPAAGSLGDDGERADARADLNLGKDPVTILDLIPGDYTITEIKAPAGYSLLREPIRFTLKTDGTVACGNAMAVVAEEDGKAILLKIKNQKLYSLPSTGGSGTGTYAVAGTLLMLCSLMYVFTFRKKKAA